MARSKNSLTDVSPSSGQLKQKFSYLERTQLNALSQTSGSLGYGAGKINGNISNSLVNYSLRDRSKLEIGALYAEGLEKSGLTSAGSGSIISSIISSSIDNRKPFYKNTSKKETDLSIPSNRVPDSNRKSPQEKIADKKVSTLANTESITFPEGLSKNAHAYVKLKFYEYKRPDKFAAGEIDPVSTINLPLPENFSQTFAVDYQSQDTKAFGQLLASEGGSELINQIESNIKDNRAAFSDIKLGDAMKEAGALAVTSGRRALLSANETVGGLVGQTLGAIPNPHPSVFLNGVNLRTYTLSWKLVPRSQGEAQIIRDIIKEIKDKALPKKDSAYLTYPHIIEPTVVTADISGDTLFSYKKSLMGGFTVNYTGEGTSAFFYDGHPVSIEISMEMQEIELFLEDTETQLGSLGTPLPDAEEDGDGGE